MIARRSFAFGTAENKAMIRSGRGSARGHRKRTRARPHIATVLHLNPDLAELVARYRDTESRDRRGPAFKAVALALESQMRSAALTKTTVLECFGPPDLFDDDVFVYRFDHEQPGRNKDEWYFDFQDDRLYGSGYNESGINDVSGLKDRSQFPSEA